MPKRQERSSDGPIASLAPPGDEPPVAPEQLERIIAQLAACGAMSDVELARHTGRKLMAALACAADVLLLDGAKTLHAAPDKVAAFFDKAAAGFAQTLEGLHRRAVLTEAAAGHPATLASRGPLALDATQISPARPRAADPLADAIAAWSEPMTEIG
jgi:hypothetical protein